MAEAKIPILAFTDVADLEAYMSGEPAQSTGFWLKLSKIGALDAAIVLRNDNWRRDGEVIIEEKFGWMGVPDFEYRPGEKLRLATQTEPCSVRGMALAALDTAGIPWTEVFIGGGVTTIGAAISAGTRRRRPRPSCRSTRYD